MSPQRSDTGARPQQRVFATTHWTVVLLAKSGRDPAARDAFAQLCESYWPPIYAFLRRSGYNPSDAEDLTQGFFLHLMEKDFLGHLTHRRGKFRSFLLTFMKNFLSDDRRYPVSQLGTNVARAAATNATADNVWGQFSGIPSRIRGGVTRAIGRMV